MSDTPRKKDNPILPDRQPEERPLFIIMAIMSFLTALTVLIGLMGFRLSHSWQQDLAGTMTIQVLEAPDPLDPDPGPKIVDIIKDISPRHSVSVVSQTESRQLLRPWIGDLDLPDDLALPALVRLDALKSDHLSQLQERLDAEGFVVDIDDHSVWRKNIQRTWRAVQIALVLIIIIIMAASTFISSYATQSVLRARQNIIDVLSHVGARENYVAQLFISRFGSLGLKAACLGTVLALLAVLVLGLFSGFMSTDLRSILGPKVSDLIFLAILAIVMGLISGATAGHITLSKLRADRLKL